MVSVEKRPVEDPPGNGVDSKWQLQEAKARFSEVVRRSQKQPQWVTVHGSPSAVVVSAEYFERMQSHISQPDLFIAASASLHGLCLATRKTGDFEDTGVPDLSVENWLR